MTLAASPSKTAGLYALVPCAGVGERSGAVGPKQYTPLAGQALVAHTLDALARVTFDEALERFRGYFTHEPIVIYFDTGSDQPMAGEEAKLDGIQEYLDNYPDATLGIDGFADIRGSEQFNFRLSDQRAQTVEALVLAQGIAAGRIDWAVGVGETQDFSQHGTAPGTAQPVDAGRLRANRRVVISFNRSSTTAPIVVP